MFGRGTGARASSAPSLKAALRDIASSTPSVRATAASALGSHGGEHRDEAIAALGKLLDDHAPEVRAAAALALADLGATDKLEDLVELSHDQEPEAGDMALAALGELKDARALPRIEQALDDERPSMRFQAVMAFARTCADEAAVRRVLVAATRDDDDLVRHIALRMAEEVAGEHGHVHPDLLDRARALLDDASDVVRVAAAIVLGHAGRRDGAEVLVGAAARTIVTDQHDDQAAAIELCGELGLKKAIPVLAERAFAKVLLFQNDPFAWHARVALAALGEERAVRWILEELSAWTRERRTLAVAAAGRARLAAARAAITAMRGDAGRADPDAVAEALSRLPEAP
jgi:HEAT repeat protein